MRRIRVIALGNKMPNWVTEIFLDYQKRIVKDFKLDLLEIPLTIRNKTTNKSVIIDKESEEILKKIKKNEKFILMDVRGKLLDTLTLSNELKSWIEYSQDVAIVIGGPDGVNSECLRKAHQVWSISRLTLPHPMVRVIMAEQIYRAWSILQNFPYHK